MRLCVKLYEFYNFVCDRFIRCICVYLIGAVLSVYRKSCIIDSFQLFFRVVHYKGAVGVALYATVTGVEACIKEYHYSLFSCKLCRFVTEDRSAACGNYRPALEVLYISGFKISEIRLALLSEYFGDSDY